MNENRFGFVFPKITKTFSNLYPFLIGKLPPLSKITTGTGYYHIIFGVSLIIIFPIKVIGESVFVCIIHCPVYRRAAIMALCYGSKPHKLLISYLKPQSG
jgi:hypothetical protein